MITIVQLSNHRDIYAPCYYYFLCHKDGKKFSKASTVGTRLSLDDMFELYSGQLLQFKLSVTK